MEFQLQDLIDRIKKEGFEASENEAGQKILQAQVQAREILEQARSEAAGIRSAARKEAENLVESGREALAQAARDISLNLDQDLRKMISTLLSDALASAYRSEVMEEAILAVAGSWSGLVPGSQVVVSPAQETALNASLKGRLAELAKRGLSVKASPRVRAGFRLEEADGSAYFDFGPDTMAKALAEYVNPGLAAIIEKRK